jgi:hypothetical protein
MVSPYLMEAEGTAFFEFLCGLNRKIGKLNIFSDKCFSLSHAVTYNLDNGNNE